MDSIEGLSPAISIEQRTTSKNPRSTVGTVTEIYDYLRLLYASVGKPHCPRCGRPIQAQTIQEMVDRTLRLPPGSRFSILAPYVAGKKGEYRKQMAEMVKEGFLRARVDGKLVDLDDPPELDKQKKHTIEIVVDRLVSKPADDEEYRNRLADSIETATRVSGGVVIVAAADGPEEILSANYACPDCGTSLTEITPRLFSFNSPYGACTTCSGLGTNLKVDPDRLVLDPGKSIEDGAIAILKPGSTNWRSRQMATLAKHYKFKLDQPFGKLPKPAQKVILYGSGEDEIKFSYVAEKGEYHWRSSFEGLVPMIERRYREIRERRAPGGAGGLHVGRAVPLVSGAPAEAGGAGRARRRPLDRRGGFRDDHGGDRVLRGPAADPAGAGDRGKDPQGDPGPAAVPRQRGDRLPQPLAGRRVAVRRRVPADPAGDPDRLEADGRPLRPGRALDRPPPAGQPQADRHADLHARPREHGDRRRARRGDDPIGRLGPGSWPGRGLAWRTDRRRGGPGGPDSLPGVLDRPVPVRRTRDPDSRAAPHGIGQGDHGARREGAQPEGSRRAVPARRHDGGHRRLGLRQVDAGQRHPLSRAGPRASRILRRSRGPTRGSRGCSRSTRSSPSTSLPSDGRRARTRRRTPTSSIPSAS